MFLLQSDSIVITGNKGDGGAAKLPDWCSFKFMVGGSNQLLAPELSKYGGL